MLYRILCDRSPARELGSGLTWLKQDGKIVEFSTTEAAGAKAKELSEARSAATVKYSVKAYDTNAAD